MGQASRPVRPRAHGKGWYSSRPRARAYISYGIESFSGDVRARNATRAYRAGAGLVSWAEPSTHLHESRPIREPYAEP